MTLEQPAVLAWTNPDKDKARVRAMVIPASRHRRAAQALRDEAVASEDFSTALRLLQAADAAHADRVPMWFRGFDTVYAHALLLGGQLVQGQALARRTMALVDTHALGRKPHWFGCERSVALLILGDDRQTITELRYSVATGQVCRRWYLAGHGPPYAHLRADPRFQALDQEVRRHRQQRQASLREIRREQGGERQPGSEPVPLR